MMKPNKATFFVIFITVLLVAFFTFTPAFKGPLNNAHNLRYGIDIRGGVEVIYAPKNLDRSPTDEELETTKVILETRLDAANILDREITIDKANGEILVRFPWKSDETTFSPQSAISELGETALLTFRSPDNTILIQGKNVKSSSVSRNTQTNTYVVNLEFDEEGSTLFSEATKKLTSQYIAIYMDEILISAPLVEEQISGGRAMISGSQQNPFTLESAQALSKKINCGALPFSLEAKSSSTISPTLGSSALKIMIISGAIAFVAVCLFMILYYRLLGVVACIGLALQLYAQILALSIPQITLTLPGIAGIILSLGMGVDTNVVIAERIKEEIRNGRSIPLAIQKGYARAFNAVLDGNVTTLIVAILLMIFGSGSMLSFGYTLLTGVLLNFISGITASKQMIASLSSYPLLKKPFLYGARRVCK